MKFDFHRALALLLLAFSVVAGAARAANIDVALVTALEGSVVRAAEQGPQPVQNFVKLKEGDLMTLGKDARLQIVYFDGGRQETWAGAGKLEVGTVASAAMNLLAPQVRILPSVMVKQIARTPALDVHGRGGVTRLRAIATPDAIAKIETNYQKLRAETNLTDLTPEFYRLAGLFEMHELDRVEQILAEIQKERATDAQAKLLVSLYKRALKDARALSGTSNN